MHRDLKPSNILINENCDLKICDFGLARVTESQMTGYVSTRYYRAPEIMLTWQKYDEAVDIWSVGCIFAEMMEGKPLFPGKDYVHQFFIITELLGTPPDDVVQTIGSESTLKFVKSLPHRDRTPFSERFKESAVIDPVAIDLLEKMLVFDPRQRVTADEALAHPYLAEYHDEADEPVAHDKFDWELVSGSGSEHGDDVADRDSMVDSDGHVEEVQEKVQEKKCSDGKRPDISLPEWTRKIFCQVVDFHFGFGTFENWVAQGWRFEGSSVSALMKPAR